MENNKQKMFKEIQLAEEAKKEIKNFNLFFIMKMIIKVKL